MPWSRKNRKLKNSDDFTLNEIFEIVKHDVSTFAIPLIILLVLPAS